MRPPVVVLPGALATHGPTPPLGAAYVAAALREAGHEVEMIDGAGEAIGEIAEVDSPVGTLERIGLSPEEIVSRMRPDTEIVGISTMFLHEWPTVRSMAALVKERFPDCFLVLGGENATAFAPYILEQSAAVDGCVMGEGEATMVTIADHLARGLPVSGLEGLMMREASSGEVVDTGLSVRLGRRELNDRIPRPAWDLVPLD
ncbi:MAG: cobalamin-dependent protein, partial [Actinomycetota bacterium]